MPKFAPVTPEQHGGKAWRRFTSYSFAAQEAVVPLNALELVNAALNMPLAFTQQGDRYGLVAVLSLDRDRNLFVAPDGRWLGGYVPALFRGYPFRLLRKQDSQEFIFCIDAEANAVVEPGAGAEAFFDPEGKLTPAAKAVFDFLVQLERASMATQAAVAALAEAGVIGPWQIKVKAPDNSERLVSGLYRIDETPLTALGDEAFLRLRKTGALPIAYAQLFSMGRLSVFEQLAKVQQQLAQARPAQTLPESLDKLFGLQSDDIVRFD